MKLKKEEEEDEGYNEDSFDRERDKGELNYLIDTYIRKLLEIYTKNEIEHKFRKMRIQNLEYNLFDVLYEYELKELPKIKETISEFWMEEPTQSPSFAILMEYIS